MADVGFRCAADSSGRFDRFVILRSSLQTSSGVKFERFYPVSLASSGHSCGSKWRLCVASNAGLLLGCRGSALPCRSIQAGFGVTCSVFGWESRSGRGRGLLLSKSAATCPQELLGCLTMVHVHVLTAFDRSAGSVFEKSSVTMSRVPRLESGSESSVGRKLRLKACVLTRMGASGGSRFLGLETVRPTSARPAQDTPNGLLAKTRAGSATSRQSLRLERQIPAKIPKDTRSGRSAGLPRICTSALYGRHPEAPQRHPRDTQCM